MAVDPALRSLRAGTLAEEQLPELLWRFHGARATGMLRVRRGPVEKDLWLTYGQPVFARSNQVEDRLTERLRLRGMLSREEYAAVQEAMENADGQQRIGQLLLAARLIERRALDESLHEQLLRILESMFNWASAEAQWTFESGVTCDEPVTLNISTAAIIMDGARDRLTLARLWTAVPSPAHRPAMTTRIADERAAATVAKDYRMHPAERAWIRRLDGSHSVGALLDDFETDERELLSVIYTLALTGKLTLQPPARAVDTVAAPAPAEDAVEPEEARDAVIADAARRRKSGPSVEL